MFDATSNLAPSKIRCLLKRVDSALSNIRVSATPNGRAIRFRERTWPGGAKARRAELRAHACARCVAVGFMGSEKRASISPTISLNRDQVLSRSVFDARGIPIHPYLSRSSRW